MRCGEVMRGVGKCGEVVVMCGGVMVRCVGVCGGRREQE